MSSIENAQNIINQRADWLRRRDIIKEQALQSLVVAIDGSFFTADAVTISLVKGLIDSGKTSAVVLDSNQLPCLIDDLSRFLTTLIEHNQISLNLYHQEYIQHVRTRNRR